MEDKLTKQLNIAIGIVFIIAAGVLVYSAAQRKPETAGEQKPAAPQQQEAAPAAATAEYDGLKGMKSVKLVENFESWTPNAKVDSAKTKAVKLEVTGNLSEAYLLVRASESGNALTKWQSVYFKLNYDGGHLFRPESLKAPESHGTTLLYDLKSVAYLPSVPYSEDRTPEHADLLGDLKSGTHPLATIFVSSLSQTTLDEATIYYACADGKDCAVSVQ